MLNDIIAKIHLENITRLENALKLKYIGLAWGSPGDRTEYILV
jgi:hypothetical protein